jgi:two-component system, NarL family, sensor kinase
MGGLSESTGKPAMKAYKPRLDGSHRIQLRKWPQVGSKGATQKAATDFDIRLLSLQEEVHQRIASDLHDSTCQHLIAASLNMMRVRRALSGGDNAEKLCDDIDGSINQALQEIRAFTYLLHPQNLLTDGLKTTIEHFVEGFSARTSLQVSFDIAPEVDRLSYERQRALLRVIQEALTNVFRHARATKVIVAIRAMSTHFRLSVSDDGRGMPVGYATSGAETMQAGVGIPAMRTRLQQMGGALEIQSSSSAECQGTTLCAAIPHSLPRKRTRLPMPRHGQASRHKINAQQH